MRLGFKIYVIFIGFYYELVGFVVLVYIYDVGLFLVNLIGGSLFIIYMLVYSIW